MLHRAGKPSRLEEVIGRYHWLLGLLPSLIFGMGIMTKAKYLQDTNVLAFLKWLRERQKPNGFVHEYYDGYARKNWKCASLHEAFKKYHWKGRDYAETSGTLANYSDRLIDAFTRRDLGELSTVWTEIYAWGGLGIFPFFQNYLNIHTAEDRYRELKALLAWWDDPSLNYQNDAGLKIDSALTKVYSLFLKNFVIYDGRVGAAMGLLVRRFFEDNPSLFHEKNWSEGHALYFAYGDGQRDKKGRLLNQSRDPSDEHGGISFSRLKNDWCRMQMNVKTSWIVDSVVGDKDSPFYKMADGHRAFEAALFMIGYDLGGPGHGIPSANSTPRQTPPLPPEKSLVTENGNSKPWKDEKFAARCNENYQRMGCTQSEAISRSCEEIGFSFNKMPVMFSASAGRGFREWRNKNWI